MKTPPLSRRAPADPVRRRVYAAAERLNDAAWAARKAGVDVNVTLARIPYEPLVGGASLGEIDVVASLYLGRRAIYPPGDPPRRRPTKRPTKRRGRKP